MLKYFTFKGVFTRYFTESSPDRTEVLNEFTDSYQKKNLSKASTLLRKHFDILQGFALDYLAKKSYLSDDFQTQFIKLCLRHRCIITPMSVEFLLKHHFIDEVKNFLKTHDYTGRIPAEWLLATDSADMIGLLHNIGVETRNLDIFSVLNIQEATRLALLLSLGYQVNSILYKHSYHYLAIILLWQHKVPVTSSCLAHIYQFPECRYIVEACLNNGIQPTGLFLFAVLQADDVALAENLLTKYPNLTVNGSCLRKIVDKIPHVQQKYFFTMLLPRFKKSESNYLHNELFWLFERLLEQHSSHTSQCIETLGYCGELLAAAIKHERTDLINECFLNDSPVYSCAIYEAAKKEDEALTVKLIECCQEPIKAEATAQCLKKFNIDTFWPLLANKGIALNQNTIDGALSGKHYDFVLSHRELIMEKKFKLSGFVLYYYYSKELLDCYYDAGFFVSLDDVLFKLTLDNPEHTSFLERYLSLRYPLKRINTEDFQQFCKKLMFCLRLWQSEENYKRCQEINAIDVLDKIYFRDNKQPMMEQVIKLLGGNVLTWRYVHPQFEVYESLSTYSPYYLNESVYDELLEYLSLECHEQIDKPLCAFKLSVIFTSSKEAKDYLDRFKKANPRTQQPIHDACLFDIPKSRPKYLDLWQALVKKNGYRMRWLQLLSFVTDIEHVFTSPFTLYWPDKDEMHLDNAATKARYLKCMWAEFNSNPSFQEKAKAFTGKPRDKLYKLIADIVLTADMDALVKKHAMKLKMSNEHIRSEILTQKNYLAELIDVMFTRRDAINYTYEYMVNLILSTVYKDINPEYYQFGLACIRGGVRKSTFDTIIKLSTTKAKKWSFLPSFSLNGSEIGIPGYIIEVLSKNDPYRGILGKLTSCCQTVDDAGGKPTLHGMTSSFGDFIVIRKENSQDTFVAQSWVGITEEGSVVFDSIEFNKGHDQTIIMRLIAAAAQKIVALNPYINGVFYGGGGNTPKVNLFPLDMDISRYSPIIGYRNGGYDSLYSRFILVPRQQEIHDVSIGVDDCYMVHGADAHISPGKKVNGLSLSPFVRHRFFTRYPGARNALKHPQNPLLEEGFYESEKEREFYGESFIPFATTKRIIEQKILARQSMGYKATHLVLLDNNLDALASQLSNINLAEGENILIGYTHDVHSIFAYIDKKEGIERCVVIDSEDPCEEAYGLKDMVCSFFPKVQYEFTRDYLQVDFYSCSTFMIKMMVEFAKYGVELTDEILATKGMHPARLLKMTQKDLAYLTDAQKQTIVTKKGLTLEQYHHQYGRLFGNRLYNASALVKKYAYLADEQNSIPEHLAPRKL